MSRIGKKPVIIPANVTVDIAEGNVVTVKGPKGSLTHAFHPDMILKIEGNELLVDRPDDEHLHKSLHGLTRTLIHNMVAHCPYIYKDGVEAFYGAQLISILLEISGQIVAVFATVFLFYTKFHKSSKNI